MRIQYTEYKTLDLDISELRNNLSADDTQSTTEEMFNISAIEDMKFKDFQIELNEIIDNGNIIDWLEMICRNKLKDIIKFIILSEKDLMIWELYNKNCFTQEEIGKRIGVTRQSINKRLRKIEGDFQRAEESTKRHLGEKEAG